MYFLQDLKIKQVIVSFAFLFCSKNLFAAKQIARVFICTENESKIKKKELVKAKFLQLLYQDQVENRRIPRCEEKNHKWQAIKLKIRGNSSAHFTKKQYLIKFFNASYETKEAMNVLELPKSHKWVLAAPYVDRSLMRNVLAFHLGRELGHLRQDPWAAPKTVFMAFHLNDKKQGVYVLTQKIQREQNFLNLPKIDLEKTLKRSPHYLLEVSSRTGDFKTKVGTEIKYRYPSIHKIEKLKKDNPSKGYKFQKNIISSLNSLEKLLKNSTILSLKELESRLDLLSFVDYILMQEISKNIDGYRRSAYFYFDLNSKIHMGPLWDFNMAFGNLNFFTLSLSKGWLYNKEHIPHRSTFWFKSLLANKKFREILISRYFLLRKEGNPLSFSFINSFLDKTYLEIKNSALIDQKIWSKTFSPVEYFIMNTRVKSYSCDANQKILKNWLQERLLWIDKNIKSI